MTTLPRLMSSCSLCSQHTGWLSLSGQDLLCPWCRLIVRYICREIVLRAIKKLLEEKK